MGNLYEETILYDLAGLTPDRLKKMFTVEEQENCHWFRKKDTPSHYITVQKERKSYEGIILSPGPVSCNFGFGTLFSSKCVGSDTFNPLLEVGKILVHAFGLTVDWET